ncbi:16S rRNA (guanine(527)-N(7))-methyltransferase RsmG [Caulobacter sp. SLTY]|uniref:16S rRNA (guanine(527)-N(7))-methyltransferase RsmG n=1 Tax=Caulobacter sp. SLTY TaxID=2683262 RepID=UPI003211CC03
MADLVRYREMLEDWNGRMNLVGPSAMAVFWSRHALDSAQLIRLAPDALTWADLGTGAGLPGLVLAILLKNREGAQVHLVESLAKRCRFLSEVVGELELPATVHNMRAEEGKIAVQMVTARAVAALPKLLGFAEPYLKRGARGLFLKGQAAESELAEARQGWRLDADLVHSLSDPDGRIVDIRSAKRGR